MGRITGVVTDATGGVLPGATVNAKAVGTGALRTVFTDEAGRFVLASLPPGDYEVTAELTGFRTTMTKVLVTVGAAANVEFKLEIAGATETVNVTGEVPLVNTSNGEVSTNINEAQIRELPTITRNVYSLVQLAGNVASDAGSGRGTGYAMNGQRSASTNVLLDGSANNDEFGAGVGQDVPLDSVQEFSVVTSNFSAQYGRATGGVVNVATKSGTNVFRGTAYEFFRSDKLATNTYDNKSNDIEKGKFTRHQSGFSIGGPVVKDKLHFFSNLEYIRVRSTDTLIGWVPTPELLAMSAKPTQDFFAKYGALDGTSSGTLTRSQVTALLGNNNPGAFNSLPADMPAFQQIRKSLPIDAGGGDPQDNYQWVGRVDYSFSPQSQFYFRYAYQNQESIAGTNSANLYKGFDTNYLNHNHNILGSYTHVYGSTFTTQTKFVYNRLESQQPLNGDPQPTLYMNPTTAPRLQGYRIAFPGYLPWGPGTAIPFGGPQKLAQFYQDQTWLKGKHDFRFGGSYVHINDDRTFGAYANAVEALNSTSAAMPSLDNFVLGQLKQFQTAINPQGYPGGTYTTPVQLPSFTSYNRYDEFALYANDNWNLAPRLTINLGVRYECYGPQKKNEPKYDSNFYYGDPNVSVSTSSPQDIINGLITGQVLPSNESPTGTLWKADKNNFAPRVGFAWDVRGDGKTSVRGGYGMSYERNFGNVTYNVLFNPPEYLVASINAPTDVASMPIYSDPAGPFGGIAGVTKTIPGGSLRHLDQNMVTAYAHFYGAGFQHDFGKLTGGFEYSGSSGRKLYDMADPNRVGAAWNYLGIGSPMVRPNTQYTAFNTRGNRGKSQYHGFTFSADSRQLGKTGLQFSARYTLAYAHDNLSSTFSDSGNDFNIGYLDPFNPSLDWGWAEFDVRHRFTMSGIWELPFAKGAGGLKEGFAGGWQLNWILTARTGYPFTLWDCTAGYAICMRAMDPIGISKNATNGTSTGSPNEFNLLDLSGLVPTAGSYTKPGFCDEDGCYSDYGPYPADMTKRDAFRGPGFWNVDFGLSKRVRFGGTRAVQFRVETYNLFNHPNMYVNSGVTDLASYDFIPGYKDGNRRIQLGLKFEF
jgi:outer membrane receptor protein involved in Fe transport